MIFSPWLSIVSKGKFHFHFPHQSCQWISSNFPSIFHLATMIHVQSKVQGCRKINKLFFVHVHRHFILFFSQAICASKLTFTCLPQIFFHISSNALIPFYSNVRGMKKKCFCLIKNMKWEFSVLRAITSNVQATKHLPCMMLKMKIERILWYVQLIWVFFFCLDSPEKWKLRNSALSIQHRQQEMHRK